MHYERDHARLASGTDTGACAARCIRHVPPPRAAAATAPPSAACSWPLVCWDLGAPRP